MRTPAGAVCAVALLWVGATWAADDEPVKRPAKPDKTYTIELTGPGSKLDAFLLAVEPAAILETVRTGASGIGRGDRIMKI